MSKGIFSYSLLLCSTFLWCFRTINHCSMMFVYVNGCCFRTIIHCSMMFMYVGECFFRTIIHCNMIFVYVSECCFKTTDYLLLLCSPFSVSFLRPWFSSLSTFDVLCIEYMRSGSVFEWSRKAAFLTICVPLPQFFLQGCFFRLKMNLKHSKSVSSKWTIVTASAICADSCVFISPQGAFISSVLWFSRTPTYYHYDVFARSRMLFQILPI